MSEKTMNNITTDSENNTKDTASENNTTENGTTENSTEDLDVTTIDETSPLHSQSPKKDPADYDASGIDVLEGPRSRSELEPTMYIGSTGPQGLHHLVYEVVDNSIDEALAGYCTRIDVIIHSNGSCSVEDNGRGIPVDIHPDKGIPAAELVLSTLHAGGKFNKDNYKVSGGLHGVGVSCVNALSERLSLDVFKDGKHYRQTYERGIKTSELTIVGDTTKEGLVFNFFQTKIFLRKPLFFQKTYWPNVFRNLHF